MALTETWLGHENDKQILHDLVPLGYKILHVSRSSGRRGGGVALLFKSNLKLKSVKTHSFDQFEHMHCSMVFNDTCVDLFVVYRPPPSSANGLKTIATANPDRNGHSVCGKPCDRLRQEPRQTR